MRWQEEEQRGCSDVLAEDLRRSSSELGGSTVGQGRLSGSRQGAAAATLALSQATLTTNGVASVSVNDAPSDGSLLPKSDHPPILKNQPGWEIDSLIPDRGRLLYFVNDDGEHVRGCTAVLERRTGPHGPESMQAASRALTPRRLLAFKEDKIESLYKALKPEVEWKERRTVLGVACSVDGSTGDIAHIHKDYTVVLRNSHGGAWWGTPVPQAWGHDESIDGALFAILDVPIDTVDDNDGYTLHLYLQDQQEVPEFTCHFLGNAQLLLALR